MAEIEKRFRNAEVLGCPRCSGNKTRGTHTFGTYRVYITNSLLKLTCKTCKLVQVYQYINGGAPYGTNNQEEDSEEEISEDESTETTNTGNSNG